MNLHLLRMKWIAVAVGLLIGSPVTAWGAVLPHGEIHFNRDIRPILSENCFFCHGPDKNKRKGDLRLDMHDDVLAEHQVDGKPVRAVVPGEAGKSELVRRIESGDSDEVMPPPKANHTLSERQKQLLREWVEQGAKWEAHWAYIRPVKAPLPTISDPAWVKNAIDGFVLARLDEEGLKPSPEADRRTLIRRVTLDLVGLPPTPEQVDAFVQDSRPDAYERVVDRLLASPQFGERWARPWLDLARYADSNGFQRDGFRDLWAWRDWVIKAMNQDMPFDQFTIEQLAGDLLPNSTIEQKIATGFHRCPTVNVEAGTDQEENRVNQVLDRVNTTATVWLGSTMECAQCHDHKYDPFTQQDYYRLFAYFNNTEQETKFRTPKDTASVDFIGPEMKLTNPQMDQRRQELDARVDALNEEIEKHKSKLPAAATTQLAWVPLDVENFESMGGASGKVLADKSVLVGGAKPATDTYTITVHTKLSGITAIQLEALTDNSLPGKGPGRGDASRPNFVLNEFQLTAAPSSDPNNGRPVQFMSARADYSQKGYDIAGAIDGVEKTGWAVGQMFHQPHAAVFVLGEPLGAEEGSVLTFTLQQNSGAKRTIGRLRLSATTSPAAAPVDAASSEIKQLLADKGKALAELKLLDASKTLVMKELPQPRVTHVLRRGNFLDPAEGVTPGTPAFLGKPAEGPPNRLTLARWLVSRDNPLTARVAVNRWWAELFGHGLVATPEDFGAKGEMPTHPELLDWLAVDFMDRGWSMKSVLRLMVTSATYRQSSRVTPELLTRDDQNKLYARGPRFRMDAEMIRDNALSAAGLLSLKKGGPPVHPWQPPGVWTVTGQVDNTYRLSEGEDLYRRGIYVVWRRSAPYPSFMNFDASVRATCRVKRSRSNTPLQALTLLNDPVYVEAAAMLARRATRDLPNGSFSDRASRICMLCWARSPDEREATALRTLFDRELQRYREDPAAAAKLLAKYGASKGPDQVEWAAWYAVATAVLNADETIAK
jgi:hypothetical protein